MSFKWTKLFRSYDLNSFTGLDSQIPNDQYRYAFKKRNGVTIYTNDKSNFLKENSNEFLGWHSEDIRKAFSFVKFSNLEQAKSYFNLEPHPVHNEKVIGYKFALHDEYTLKMTIEFKSIADWKKFYIRNNDSHDPISHGMKTYGLCVEYDKDHPGNNDHVS